ncbi:hypothetical protein DFR50_109179 [Roseiarcus fermentans]|uniref:PepSY domain-containing protein n=1 Tax=Roseiarcus fermentans TaxID=1473586 RepID=A0A366FL18_9HYPH|nr:hypothetical protein [Roseiarcus fermentans]RBP14425.1 hypothetical protein DFR50_109179 [Roseiarcus fermentans]
MIALARPVFAALLATTLAAPAFAASDAASAPTMGATKSNDAVGGPSNAATNAQNPTGTPNAGTSATGAMSIAQKMRDDLGKAGFTDIRVMPSSFLVRAKDSSGNPVMMVINPDSITAITEAPANAATGSTARQGAGAQPAAPGAPKTP